MVTIQGFAQAGMIARLHRAGWRKCDPEGRGFEPLELGGYTLCDAPDKLCSVHYRIKIKCAGEEFWVSGYSFPNLLKGAQNSQDPAWGKNKLFQEELQEKQTLGKVLYEIVIEY